jgi:hypothetical protein
LYLDVPPFPFAPHADRRGSSAIGMPVRFRCPLTEDESWHLHFASFASNRTPRRPVIFETQSMCLGSSLALVDEQQICIDFQCEGDCLDFAAIQHLRECRRDTGVLWRFDRDERG